MKIDVMYMFQLVIFLTFLTTVFMSFYCCTHVKYSRISLKIFKKLKKGRNIFFHKLTVKDYTAYEKFNIWWYCSHFKYDVL